MEDIGNYGYTLFRTQPKGEKKRVQCDTKRSRIAPVYVETEPLLSETDDALCGFTRWLLLIFCRRIARRLMADFF